MLAGFKNLRITCEDAPKHVTRRTVSLSVTSHASRQEKKSDLMPDKAGSDQFCYPPFVRSHFVATVILKDINQLKFHS